jgi:hypothetical protein
MAFTRPTYDPCAYDKDLDESTSVLSYLLDPSKFYNCNECRIEFGVVGGNAVSRTQHNIVELENDLRGQTRQYSQCPHKKYIPGTIIQGKANNGCKPGCGADGLPCGSAACKNDNLRHLPACNMIQYKPRIDNVGYKLDYPPCPGYGAPAGTGQKVKKAKKYTPSAWQGQQGYAKY